MKITEEKLGGVAYAYVGGLLDLWRDSILEDVGEVAEKAAQDMPELADKYDLIEQSIRTATEDVYAHANAYALVKFSMLTTKGTTSVAEIFESKLN